jgi:signal transduction histidine kinase
MQSKLLSNLESQDFLRSFIEEMDKNLSLDDFFSITLDLICNYFSFSSSCVILANFNLTENSESKVNSYYVSKEFYSLHQTIKLLENIIPCYHSLLINGNYVTLSDRAKSLPKNVSEILKEYELNFLGLVPINYRKKYLGTIIFFQQNYEDQLTEIKLNLLSSISTLYGIFLHQIHLETTLKEEQKINTKLKINASKREYLLQMNHELKTPMTSIIGFAKMLKQQIYGELNPKQMEYTKKIYDAGIYLLALINDLLDITKIEANKEKLFIEKIVIEEICQASLSLVQVKAKEQKLTLNLVIDSDINYFYGDTRKLQQILVNLLSNAVKFTETGGVTLKVEKKLTTLEFSVIDTGIGIKKSAQQKIFQPFFQLKTHLHKRHRGTGLGLALSIKLARLHGGDITLISEEGKGSCFTCHLPLKL